MKKTVVFFLVIAILICALSSCACKHDFAPATCTKPATCSKCGETQGETLGHSFNAATCTTPATCTKCGETQGEALGHSFNAATCTTPATCTKCGITQGTVLGHTVGIGTCPRCGKNSYVLKTQAAQIDRYFTNYLNYCETAAGELADSFTFLSDTYRDNYISRALLTLCVDASGELIKITNTFSSIDKIGNYPELNDLKVMIKELLTISQDIAEYGSVTGNLLELRGFMTDKLSEMLDYFDDITLIIDSWSLN